LNLLRRPICLTFYYIINLKKFQIFAAATWAPQTLLQLIQLQLISKIFAAPAGAARSCFLQLSQNLTQGELCARTLDPQNLTRFKI